MVGCLAVTISILEFDSSILSGQSPVINDELHITILVGQEILGYRRGGYVPLGPRFANNKSCAGVKPDHVAALHRSIPRVSHNP